MTMEATFSSLPKFSSISVMTKLRQNTPLEMRRLFRSTTPKFASFFMSMCGSHSSSSSSLNDSNDSTATSFMSPVNPTLRQTRSSNDASVSTPLQRYFRSKLENRSRACPGKSERYSFMKSICSSNEAVINKSTSSTSASTSSFNSSI